MYATLMKLMMAYMEETTEQGLDVSCPRKLNFNLPLLSIRRFGGYTGSEDASCRSNSHVALQDTSDRIPFCWERAPGEPKDAERNETHDGETPRPRPPPCRWHLEKEAEKKVNHDCVVNLDDHDDGCDADVDDCDDEDDENDVFSDAIDVLSLTEAIDIVQKSDDGHGLDRLKLESIDSADRQFSNFMMERFLPDATALAAPSALYALNNLNKKLPYARHFPEEYVSRTVGQPCPSETSHTGCGLEVLWPWRMKHKLCGVKSPVRHVSQKIQPQYCSSAKQKKHCSSNRPFKDVNKHI